MKKVVFKFSRGLVGFFTLKLSLLILVFVVVSCQDNMRPNYHFDQNVIDEYASFVQTGLFSSMSRSQASIEEGSVTEQQAKALMKDLTERSMSFLRGLGFSEEDINSELGGINSPSTSVVALILLENIKTDQLTSSKNIWINQAYAKSDVWGCIGEAFGFAAVGYLLEYGIEEAIEHYGKKGLIKVLGKAAGKTLGWIGLAVAAYEFATCMAE
ncbi:hypothetical protein [Roseivirga sp.]|uniref:hypothetical protein n=1 Tax=Roseivirga sp. TaxID=1964215 RepID=UPI003B51D117